MKTLIDLNPNILNNFKIYNLYNNTFNIKDYNINKQPYKISHDKDLLTIPLKNEMIININKNYWVKPYTNDKTNIYNNINIEEYIIGANYKNSNIIIYDNIFHFLTKIQLPLNLKYKLTAFFIINDEKYNYRYKFYDYISNRNNLLVNKFSANPKYLNSKLCINCYINGINIYNKNFNITRQYYLKKSRDFTNHFSLYG